MPNREGGNFIAPRTVMKCICFGDFVVYNGGKMSFSNLMAVGDLGIPRGYIAFRGAIRDAQEESSSASNERRERAFNDNLVRMNRPRE